MKLSAELLPTHRGRAQTLTVGFMKHLISVSTKPAAGHVATRFDKLARNFLAGVTLASARLWLRAHESRT